MEAFADHVKKALSGQALKHTAPVKDKGATHRDVRGSGAFLMDDAARSGADVYVTSDVKYHEYFQAEGRFQLLDVGHYESEWQTSTLIANKINEEILIFAVRLSSTRTNPVPTAEQRLISNRMAKKKSSTAEDKLRALFDLQIIDSRIDRLRVVRGELPLEVQDLEDELEGLRARLERMEDDNDQVNQRIAAYQMQIKDSQALIEKYTEQQNNVRNNREFESLAKEIEYQTLEIELCEKRIRECKAQVEQKAEGLGRNT